MIGNHQGSNWIANLFYQGPTISRSDYPMRRISAPLKNGQEVIVVVGKKKTGPTGSILIR